MGHWLGNGTYKDTSATFPVEVHVYRDGHDDLVAEVAFEGESTFGTAVEPDGTRSLRFHYAMPSERRGLVDVEVTKDSRWMKGGLRIEEKDGTVRHARLVLEARNRRPKDVLVEPAAGPTTPVEPPATAITPLASTEPENPGPTPDSWEFEQHLEAGRDSRSDPSGAWTPVDHRRVAEPRNAGADAPAGRIE
jgi:hypothetical protein